MIFVTFENITEIYVYIPEIAIKTHLIIAYEIQTQ